MEITTPFKTTQPQQDILDSRQPVNLFLAGQGSGKSHCAGLVAALYVMNFPAMRGIICANTYGQLTRSTLFRIREVWRDTFELTEYLDGSGKGNYVVGRQPPKKFATKGHNFDSYDNIISFDNGAVIYIGSLDNYKALDGIEICWAILDETKDTREEAVKQVIVGRLRQRGLFVTDTGEITGVQLAAMTGVQGAGASPAPTMCIPFNPLYIFTSSASVPWINEWFFLKDYEREINQKIFSEHTYFKQVVSNKFVVISSTYHNADNLPENYIANQKANLHTSLQDLLIYGSPFGKSGGEFYKCFDRNKHVAKLTEIMPEVFGTGPKPYCPDRALLISIDENAVPYFPMGIYQMVGLTLCKIDEICAEWPNNTVNYICEEFSRRFYHHNAGISIFGDATSQKDDVKQQKGYDLYRLIQNKLSWYHNVRRMVSQSNPSVRGRCDFINTVLEKEVFGCKFLIDADCQKTIADYNNTREAPDRTKDKRTITDPATKRSYQPWGHLTDEGDYIMCVVWATQYRKYMYGDRKQELLWARPRNGRY